jgi:hypothetical protein
LSSPVGFSDSPEITPDGRYVAFFSTATNLVGNTNPAGDVYVRDLVAGTTICASTNARGTIESTGFNFNFTSTNLFSCNHRISTNGHYVVFQACLGTSASSLPTTGFILRYNMQSGLTDIVSRNANVPFTRLEHIRSLDISPDGQFVAFVGNVGAIPAANTAIYLWDAQTGTNTAVSLNVSNALPASTLCDWPTVDSTGRYVAFVCNAPNMVTNLIAGEFNLFVRDAQTGTTRLVNVDTNGIATGVDPSVRPCLSADGRFVAFNCPDAGIVANDHNHANDVFVRDLGAETTHLISNHDPSLPSVTGSGINWLSSFSVSTNGRYVAFASIADYLVPNDTNGLRDVFVRDVVEGTNILASAAANGAVCSGQSSEPAISGDGRYVAFASWATNLVGGDTNKARDIFVRDLQSGTTSLVSVSTNGVSPGDASSEFPPSISIDGRYVLFVSAARNLTTNQFPPVLDLFLRDLQLGKTYRPSPDSSGLYSATQGTMTPDGRYVLFIWGNWMSIWDSQSSTWIYTNSSPLAFAISPNGQRLAYMNASTLSVTDVPANTNWVISALALSDRPNPQFSSDGRYLTYTTSASNAVNDANGTADVYLYDFETGTNQLISRGYFSSGAPNGVSDYPTISGDGRFIAYRGFASNNIPNDHNEVPDLFLYDRLSATTLLVTSDRSGDFAADNRSSVVPVFSGDSKTLVFHSWASDLVANDFNNAADLFALSLVPLPLTDSDNDGMDDQWESDHFETLDHDGAGDYDNDGATDLSEFQSGTDPANPTFLFEVKIANPVAEGHSPMIHWPSAPGKVYRVQYKNNLDDPAWQNLNGNMVVVGNKGYIIDLAPDAAQRFYRVVLVTDLDGDGMGDQWEEMHFGTLNRDGTGDFDGDGATDLFEFQSGTIPTDPASQFSARIVWSEGPGITWKTAPGKFYRVQYTDNLFEPSWLDLNEPITVVGNDAAVADLLWPTGQRYYRILLIQ